MPKLALLLGLFSLAACTQALAPSTANNPESLCGAARWQPVAANTWYLAGSPARSNAQNRGLTSNSVLLKPQGQNPAWLLGQGPSPRWGQALQCSAQAQLGLVISDTISARAHPESVLGLAAFERARQWAWPQVQIAMRERCPGCTAALAQSTGDETIAQHAIRIPSLSFGATEVTEPDVVAQASTAGLRIFALKRSPTDWTTVVHATTDGVWLAPGLLWGPGVAPDLRDADLSAMILALQWLQAQNPRLLVPEQGAPTDAQGLALNLAYWRSLEQQLGDAIRAGRWLDDELITKTMKNPTWTAINVGSSTDQQAFNRERHLLNLQRVWRELENAYFQSIRTR